MTEYKLTGTVKKFSQEGRKLGYPTANIECEANAPEGVFVGYTKLINKRLPSIIFVGTPITLGETLKRAESHILDYEDKDLYGQSIQIEIERKLRDNEKFNSRVDLIKQMKQDEQLARKYFENHK